MLAEVWGIHDADRAHYVRVYMTNLRQKLEPVPARPRHLLTELQFGYRLVGLETVGMADGPRGAASAGLTTEIPLPCAGARKRLFSSM